MTALRLATTLGLLALLSPDRARAQEHPLAVTVDAVAGGGPRTRYTGTTWFRGSGTAYGRLAVAVIGPPIHGIRPFLTVDRSIVLENGDEVSMCDPAPDGGCFRHFPRGAGTFLGVGIRASPARWADIGLAAGGGSMGGASQYVDGDLAIRIATHVRLLAVVRRVVISSTVRRASLVAADCGGHPPAMSPHRDHAT